MDAGRERPYLGAGHHAKHDGDARLGYRERPDLYQDRGTDRLDLDAFITLGGAGREPGGGCGRGDVLRVRPWRGHASDTLLRCRYGHAIRDGGEQYGSIGIA